MTTARHNPSLIFLNRFKQKFNPIIENYLQEEIRKIGKVEKKSEELLSEILRFVKSGGKRIRPASMYYVYRAVGGKQKEKILHACMSIELLHTFAVIHDDIIDKSDTRRGVLTVHKSLESKYKKQRLRDYKHLAMSSALLAGDLAFALAEKTLNESGFPQNRIKRSQDALYTAKNKTILGQHLDLISSAEGSIPKENVVNAILENKTAVYTFECPIALGAILAGITDAELKILKRIGNLLGRVFQIQDDILGIFGTEKILGKSVTSDLAEGKKTLLISKAFQSANPRQKKTLKNVLGSAEITSKALNKVRNIITDTGSLEYSQKLASNYIKRAERLIKAAPLSNEGEEFLSCVARYLLVRTY